MKYGVLGRKLSHTLSPMLHNYYGNSEYCVFEREPSEVEEFIKHGDYSGINITVPYKKTAYECAERLSECAKDTESVNTLVRESDGSLTGYNTDCFGFEYLLKKNGFDIKNKKILVLGDGGAAAAVKYVAKKSGAEFFTVSRKGKIRFEDIYKFYGVDFVVNATPVGMFPNCPQKIISLENFTDLQGVIDLIYNPLKTALLLEAEERNIKSANGMLMLAAQGKYSAELFFNKKIEDAYIDNAADLITKSVRNIVFIGMPGCGKNSVGKKCAEILGKKFIDTDSEIFNLTEKTPKAIITEDGEGNFRKYESAVIETVGKEHGVIISTGGGAVISEKNFCPLKQNSVIIWLKREISKLEVSDRPLSQNLDMLYSKRKEKYMSYCDISVEVQDSVNATAEAVINKLKEAKFL